MMWNDHGLENTPNLKFQRRTDFVDQNVCAINPLILTFCFQKVSNKSNQHINTSNTSNTSGGLLSKIPQFLRLPLNLCIIQFSIWSRPKQKSMSSMPLGNVNIQHYNQRWKLANDWKLSFSGSSNSSGRATWSKLGQVTDCRVVNRKVALSPNPTPVLCFHIDAKGKIPFGMNPLLMDFANFQDASLRSVMGEVAATKSPGKIGSKWCMFFVFVRIVGCCGMGQTRIHYLWLLTVILHN